MAENAFKITQSDNGLSVRYEFTAHYITDEEAQSILNYINQLKIENEKLRKLCIEIWCSCPVSDDGCVYCKHGGPKGTVDCDLWDTMHELFTEEKGGE